MSDTMYLTLKKGDILRVRETSAAWRGCLAYVAQDYSGDGGPIRCELWLPPRRGKQEVLYGNFRPDELEFIAAHGEGRRL